MPTTVPRLADICNMPLAKPKSSGGTLDVSADMYGGVVRPSAIPDKMSAAMTTAMFWVLAPTAKSPAAKKPATTKKIGMRKTWMNSTVVAKKEWVLRGSRRGQTERSMGL